VMMPTVPETVPTICTSSLLAPIGKFSSPRVTYPHPANTVVPDGFLIVALTMLYGAAAQWLMKALLA